MSKHDELERLAEAFPADLDWDSNMEPFFNGPSGESLGGGATGFYCVYGKPFRLEGDDYEYDGPTYVEACSADFAKFMVAAREGVLALIAENEALRKDAERYRWLRKGQRAGLEYVEGLCIDQWREDGIGEQVTLEEADAAIDAAIGKGEQS